MNDLPRNWAVARIGELCSLNNGRAFKPTEWTTQGLPIVRIQNLNNANAAFNYFRGEYAERYCLRGGELLFAWSGTPGTSFGAHIWRGGKAVLNQHIFRVDFDESLLDKRFFRFAINQKLNELIGIAHGGVGLRHVTKGTFEATEIAQPPIDEQTRIADKLDAVLARVDACRDRLDCLPGILKRFRQSVLAAATSGELTKKSSGNARLDWSFARAQDVCAKVQSGGTPKEGFLSSPGIPFLKVYNIVGQEVAFEYRPQFVATEVHESSLAKSRVLPGDVLMNIVGPPLGKVALVPDTFAQWNINQAIAMFRPSDRITSGWLYCVLCSGSNIAEIVHETRGSAGQINISLSQCRDFIFPVPPLDEQAEIVRRVESLFAWADRLESRHAAARAQVERLTPSLLAKAFRGELVPQDPADEPASELLKRLTRQPSANPIAPVKRQGSKPLHAKASQAASNVREESSS